ncbi:hypothetical protein PR048_011412 [Dryococelus australis]|uniref:Uncharacterized protein n=1 Tax=Dryococelus australis TaxID=614101 RepID=A0ABQ9HM96_9NEOP|nr:hypothetical protein PR048_011412 [Dryococelus australis]
MHSHARTLCTTVYYRWAEIMHACRHTSPISQIVHPPLLYHGLVPDLEVTLLHGHEGTFMGARSRLGQSGSKRAFSWLLALLPDLIALERTWMACLITHPQTLNQGTGVIAVMPYERQLQKSLDRPGLTTSRQADAFANRPRGVFREVKTLCTSQWKCKFKARMASAKIQHSTFTAHLAQGLYKNCSPRSTGFNPGQVTPTFPQVGIVPNDAAGVQVYSGISRFPHLCIPAPLHYHIFSPSSALKTSLLRATQISQINILIGWRRSDTPILRSPLDAGRTWQVDAPRLVLAYIGASFRHTCPRLQSGGEVIFPEVISHIRSIPSRLTPLPPLPSTILISPT